MKYSSEKRAGALIFIGAAQFILCLIVAESLYPNYSISENYISDLGVGPSAYIFNSSVFLLGLAAVLSAYYLRCAVSQKMFKIFLWLCGIGAMGVGLFTENFGIIHTVFSLLAFLFGALSAVASYKIQRFPLSYIAVALGLFSIGALVLFAVSEYFFHAYSSSFLYLGLGKGGMERLIAYPILLWSLGFGGHLIGQPENFNN